jgi:nucleotide-binding universal stress UspA family protein
MLHRILVPLDGSSVSEEALGYARQVVAHGDTIDLLTVVDTPEYPASMFYPAGLPTYDLTRQDVQGEVVPQAEQYLGKIADSLRAEGFVVHIRVVIGEPAAIIVEQAEEDAVDAIVMSTHGRSGISRWLFGSVANKVLSISHIPVFIVPVRQAKKIASTE